MPEVNSSSINPEDFRHLLAEEPTPTPPTPATSMPLQISEDMEKPIGGDDETVVSEPEMSSSSPSVSATHFVEELPIEPDESDASLEMLSQLTPEQIQSLLTIAQGKVPQSRPVPGTESITSGNEDTVDSNTAVEDAVDEDVQEEVILPKRGWRRFAAKLGLPISPTQAEIEEAMWERVVRTPINHSVVIGSTSLKGGCGKTTASVMMATVIKRANPDASVVIADLDPTGNVVNRAKSPQVADIQTYVEAIKQGALDPKPYVVPTYDGVDILGARMDVTKNSLSQQEAVAVIESLSKFYGYVIVDMPYFTDKDMAYPAMLAMLDVVVFLFESKNDSLETLKNMNPILHMTDNDYLVPRRVVAFNHTKPSSQADNFDPTGYIEPLLEDEEIEVVELPYDDHLYWSDAIEGDQIGDNRYRQFLQLAAAALYLVDRSPREKLSVLPN